MGMMTRLEAHLTEGKNGKRRNLLSVREKRIMSILLKRSARLKFKVPSLKLYAAGLTDKVARLITAGAGQMSKAVGQTASAVGRPASPLY